MQPSPAEMILYNYITINITSINTKLAYLSILPKVITDSFSKKPLASPLKFQRQLYSSLLSCSINSVRQQYSGRFWHVQMNTVPIKRDPTAQRMSDSRNVSSMTFSGLGASLYNDVWNLVDANLYKASKFRKSYVKSGNMSKTTYWYCCNAGFIHGKFMYINVR